VRLDGVVVVMVIFVVLPEASQTRARSLAPGRLASGY